MKLSELCHLQSKAKMVCEKLAKEAEGIARSRYLNAQYDGDNDVSVSVVQTNKGCTVKASGKSVLFIEFGAGAKEGYAHASLAGYAAEHGFGPGTWSDGPEGKGHWNDPKGWYIPGGGGHTYGNPPEMAMYFAAKEAKRRIPEVAREVFGT